MVTVTEHDTWKRPLKSQWKHQFFLFLYKITPLVIKNHYANFLSNLSALLFSYCPFSRKLCRANWRKNILKYKKVSVSFLTKADKVALRRHSGCSFPKKVRCRTIFFIYNDKEEQKHQFSIIKLMLKIVFSRDPRI